MVFMTLLWMDRHESEYVSFAGGLCDVSVSFQNTLILVKGP